MIVKIISGILILITIYINFKHGWAGISNTLKPSELEMMTGIGLNDIAIKILSIESLLVCILVLFPQTFFAGNILNALAIVTIIAFSLKTGNIKTALIEIPFLLMPLILIWLKHPFRG